MTRQLNQPVVIRKTIFVSAADDDVMRRALSYWRERGFRFDDPPGDLRHPLEGVERTGRRGSLWGNLTAFDMSKLRATLEIVHRPREGATDSAQSLVAQIEFTMTVDTIHQFITEWNAAYWVREMDTAESWLLRSDKQESEWRAFNRSCHKANWWWGLTLGMFGRSQPPDEH